MTQEIKDQLDAMLVEAGVNPAEADAYERIFQIRWYLEDAQSMFFDLPESRPQMLKLVDAAAGELARTREMICGGGR